MCRKPFFFAFVTYTTHQNFTKFIIYERKNSLRLFFFHNNPNNIHTATSRLLTSRSLPSQRRLVLLHDNIIGMHVESYTLYYSQMEICIFKQACSFITFAFMRSTFSMHFYTYEHFNNEMRQKKSEREMFFYFHYSRSFAHYYKRQHHHHRQERMKERMLNV